MNRTPTTCLAVVAMALPAAALAATHAATAMSPQVTPHPAIDVAKLWDFREPALSEQRFRDALVGASAVEALILQTQIARSHGLRNDFVRAREVLAAIAPQALLASPEAKTRYWLELGRSHVSAAHSAETLTAQALAQARSHYAIAFETAKAGALDALAIDALHMMAFVDTAPADQLAWNLLALAHLEASTQADARQWEASLRHNTGQALHQLGRYDEAITQFKASADARQRAGNLRGVRIAQWMQAHSLRMQGKLQLALEIQLQLEREWAAAGEADRYVFEELAALYRALGDGARARGYAHKSKPAP